MMDLVPYSLKNQRTVLKKVRCYNTSLDIDVLVLNSWKDSLPVVALIKDSDDLISVLEIPKPKEDLISILSPGRCLSLQQIAVGRKINITQYVELL